MIRTLLVGCGAIGRRHVRNICALRDTRAVALSVADAEFGRAEACASEHDVVLETAPLSQLPHDKYDAVILCTPNHLHVEQALSALDAGCHVFVEKPVAVVSEDAALLQERMRQRERFVMVGCNLRFHPGVSALKRQLDDGAIGAPLYARAIFAHYLPNWRAPSDYRDFYSAHHAQGGGIVLDAIHEPDYLTHLFGKPELEGSWSGQSGALDLDVEDLSSYVLRHGSGVRSFVHVDYLRQDKYRACEVIGTEGTLIWESIGKAPERVSVRKFTREDQQWMDIEAIDAYDANVQYVDEMAYFLDCVQRGETPINGPDEAQAVLGAVEAVRPSKPFTIGNVQRAGGAA